jgi:hypothetical protein
LLIAGLGTAIVMGAAGAVLYHQGALREAYRAAIEINVARRHSGHAVGTYNVPRSLAQLRPIAGIALLALTGGVVSLIANRPSGGRVDESSPALRRLGAPTVVFLLAWLVIGGYWVGAGPAHLPRYWHGTFVPMMWLLAQGIVYLLEACAHGTTAGRYTVIVGAAMLAILTLGQPVRNIYADALRAGYYAENRSERARLIAVGERIGVYTAPDDPIHVWGYNPGVYRFSGRRAVTRFGGLETIYFLNAFGRVMAEEVVGALRARPPKLMVVERPLLDSLRAGRIGPFELEGLAEWFSSRYEPIETGGPFDLFGLRGAYGAPGAPIGPMDDSPGD